MSYAELKARSCFSFLEGASTPEELVVQAAHLGLAGIGLSDRSGVYGVPRAFAALKRLPVSLHSKPLKLITATELEIDGMNLNFIPLNRAAYGRVCRLITLAHADQPKGQARLSWEAFLQFCFRFQGLADVLVFLDPNASHAVKAIPALCDLFSGRLYFWLTRALEGDDSKRLEHAVLSSQRFSIPLVATNDVHYHVREQKRLQDVMVAIRQNTLIHQAGYAFFPNGERFLRSPDEMRALFLDFPDALSRTLEITERVEFCPSQLRYRYPSEWLPEGETASSYLERLVWEGANGRYPKGVPQDVQQQLIHELKLISSLGFSDYFLTIWEIVAFARSRGILCQGRGSAANSAACFCLGITAIDPVQMKLLFERFISAERGEPPDIDVDFEHERREEVIQFIYERYGRDRAGMVSAVITYQKRSILRDLKKALGESVSDESPEFKALAEKLYGLPRHLSIHSGGFTLSADPLVEIVPIEPARKEGRTIIQWDKNDLETLGLLKVDILALGMLSALKKTLTQVSEIKNEPWDLASIPADDPLTYQKIRAGETVGVFQIESRAQMNMLKRLLPENYYDLVVQVAIVRPGPIQGQMVHPYLKRRRGLEAIDFPHPKLVPILGRTLGVPLFQEQVMQIAVALAGFTPGEADALRRAIAGWRASGTLEQMGLKLKRGLLESGLPLEFVDRIFKQIQGFAEYGFPESHAASFALLAYASAYLKHHYPAEFTASLINSQPMGFYSSSTLLEDVKRQGIAVLPLDLNESDWDCRAIRSEAIRLGFRLVRGMSEGEFEKLKTARSQFPLKGLSDLLSRVHLKPKTLERLASARVLGEPRAALWDILGYQIEKGALITPESTHATSHATSGMQMTLFKPRTLVEQVFSDYDSYRYSLHAHPLAALRSSGALQVSDRVMKTTSKSVKAAAQGTRVTMMGLVITKQKPQTASGLVFATLEDEWGFLDVVFMPDKVERYRDIIWGEVFVMVRGEVQRDGEAVSIKAGTVEPLFDAWEEDPSDPEHLELPELSPATEWG